MLELRDIIEFVQDQTGYRKPISEDMDLDRDIGMFGDDMDAFLRAYAERFEVDMSPYLWYFHTGEEGTNFGALLFKPPDQRVEHMAVTPAVLLRSARAGVWSVTYPDHVLPDRRLDLEINQGCGAAFFILMAAALFWKYVLLDGGRT